MQPRVEGDGSAEWWDFELANRRIIAESGESYQNRSDCVAAIKLVKGSGSAPEIEE